MTRQKVIDLLAMSRFANLPTVWSNGLLGVLIGWSAFPDQAHLCPICVTLSGISLSFLYLGGCFLTIGTISILILRPAQIALSLPDAGLAKPFFHSPLSSWVEDSLLSLLSARPPDCSPLVS
jgi:hypothetical protein